MFAKLGHFSEAMALFKEMKGHHVRPNLVTYSALISACAKAGRSEEALSLFIETQSHKLAPNQYTMGALLNALTSGDNPTYEQVARAMGVFTWMETQTIAPDQGIYSMLILMCARASRSVEMKALLTKSLDSPVTLPSILTFNALLDILWTRRMRRDAANTCLLAQNHQIYGSPEQRISGIQQGRGAEQTECWSLDLHNMSVGAALTHTAMWLLNMQRIVRDGGQLPASMQIITGKGNNSKTESMAPVKSAVSDWLNNLDSPFLVDGNNKGVMVAIGIEASSWISSLRKDVVLEQFEIETLQTVSTSVPMIM